MSLITQNKAMQSIPKDTSNLENLFRKFKKSNSAVVIFGCGLEGKLVLFAMSFYGIKPDYFIDSNEKLQGKYFQGIKTISAKELSNLSPDAHIFIAHKWISVAIELLNKLNFKNIHTSVELVKSINFPKKNDLKRLNINMSPLALERFMEVINFNYFKFLGESNGAKKTDDTFFVKYIDVVITERCSMKCRDCSNLMQYYHKPQNSDTSLIFKSIDKFMECIDQVYELRVIGGDPFMNKEMYKIINKLVKYEKAKNITIYTNAKIVPKGKNLECLKNEKVRLKITDYGNSAATRTWNYIQKKHDEIVKLLTLNNIKFISEKVIKWDDIGKLEFVKETPKQLQKKFNDCCANDLFTLQDGILYKCPVSSNGTSLKAFPYDSNYDGVNLADDKISLENLRKKLKDFYHNNKYITACSYCKGRGYGEGEVEAAIQTKKPLPIYS